MPRWNGLEPNSTCTRARRVAVNDMVSAVVRRLALVLGALAMAASNSGCFRISGSLTSLFSPSIQGQILTFANTQNLRVSPSRDAGRKTSQRSLATCKTVKVSLYAILANGYPGGSPLETVGMASDGTYSFSHFESADPLANDGSLNGHYFVMATGCGTSYGRLLTGTNGQDVTFGSSLISFVLNSTASANVSSAALTQIAALQESLIGYEDYGDAYAALTADPSKFNTTFSASLRS